MPQRDLVMRCDAMQAELNALYSEPAAGSKSWAMPRSSTETATSTWTRN